MRKINISIMPTNLTGDFYKKSLESLAIQSIAPDLCIIVKDTDKRIKIETVGLSNVQVLQNDGNLGQAKSLNAAFKLIAQTHPENTVGSITIIDDDDIWIDINKTRKQLDILRSNTNIGVVGTRAASVDTSGLIFDTGLNQYYGKVDFDILQKENPITHSSVMFSPNLIYRQPELYQEDLKRSQDIELWARIIKQNSFQIKIISDVCVQHRHDKKISTRRIRKEFQDLSSNKKIIKMHPELKEILPTNIVTRIKIALNKKN